MPSRVGHITKINEDGSCHVKNDVNGEESFGRLIVMSGGMICFDLIDARKRTVASGRVREDGAPPKADVQAQDPEEKPKPSRRKKPRGAARRGTRVTVPTSPPSGDTG